MVDIATFRKLALSFPGTAEKPHFERTAFRTTARIFATVDAEGKTANLKLTPIDQSVFCDIDKTKIYPVDNKWGQQGWTTFVLSKISSRLLKDALSRVYALAIPVKK